jgi:hypothetical protein
MSTFGKKALLSWDYNSDDKQRFLNSNEDIQLEILKKWYPIGEKFYTKSLNDEYIITEYIKYLGFYLLAGIDTHLIRTMYSPLSLKEPKWVKRDRNIKLLLK